MRRRLALCGLAGMVAVGLAAAPAQPPKAKPRAQQTIQTLPNLGDSVPASLLKHPKTCETDPGLHEPCAVLTAGRERVTLGWDASTRRITYLYTSTIDTDDDLRAGDLLDIDSETPITPYPGVANPHRFVSSDWCDTDSDLSGDALWCAVMVPVRPRSGRVLGFVQSIYLSLPDPDPPPMHRTAARKRGIGSTRYPG